MCSGDMDLKSRKICNVHTFLKKDSCKFVTKEIMAASILPLNFPKIGVSATNFAF